MRSVKRFRGIGIGLGLLLAVGASGAQPPPPGQPPMPPPAPTVSPEPPAPTVPPPASQPPSVAPGETPPPGVMPAAEEMVYLNVQSGEITDIIKQISKATGRNFIIDEKVKGKITIISERPMTKEEAYQTFLSALETTGYTVVRGPSGILKIVPLDRVEQRPIPTHVDTTPATDSYITRVIKLNNINPQEMANAIQPLTKGKIYPSNITNTLILTDSGANIDRLMKIIKELDREGPQQVLEIIPIRNANAKDIAAMVQNLFLEQEKARAKPKPGEPEEIPEVSKIVPDDRTNSVIVIASKRHIDHVRAIVARLDARVAEGQEGKIHVYNVKYARAKALAETLSNLTAGAGASKPAGGATPTTGAPRIAELEGGVKVGYDEATNALLVTASAKDFKTLVDRVISKLDVLRRQVYLEAVVMELRINKQRTLGVAAHGGGGGNVIGFGQSFGAIPALQGSFLTGGATAPALLGGLISRQTVAVNVINPADGTTKAINIPAFSAFLSALSSYGDANIISTPNLLTLDNEPAEIEVRREEPVPGQQTIQANIAVAGPPTYEKAGLLMKITPQIGFGDTVNLKIEQEKSDFGPPRTINNNPVPSRIKRTVKTAVMCQDGQTVVLGGLMEDELRNTKTKIPGLGDIPILGLLFQQTTKISDKTNLLLFITPHIVKDATDFNEILKVKIDERNKFIQANYGKRQQEYIRESIRTHREDLLEYKEGEVAPLTAPTASPAPLPAPASCGSAAARSKSGRFAECDVTPATALAPSAPVAPTPQRATSPIAAPKEAARAPVITAPSVGGVPVGAESVPLAPGVGVQTTAKQARSVLAKEIPAWTPPPEPLRPPPTPSTPAPAAAPSAWQQLRNGYAPPAPGARKNGLKLGY